MARVFSPPGAVYHEMQTPSGEPMSWGWCRLLAPAKGQPDRYATDWCGEHAERNSQTQPAQPAQGATIHRIGPHRHAAELLRESLQKAEAGEVHAVGLVLVSAQHQLLDAIQREAGWLIATPPDSVGGLPPRLRQTLDALCRGQSEKQIAADLELSTHTVHDYVKALHQRFGVQSRGELLARVMGR